MVVVSIDQAPPDQQNPPANFPPPQNPPAHIPITIPPPPLLGHIPNPPAQVPSSEQPQNPPPQAPNPVQHPNSPVQVPNPVQLPNSPAHVPDPMQPPNLPVQVPNPITTTKSPTTSTKTNATTRTPAHVLNPMLPQAPPVQTPQLNWSYFKPEFSGKPEKEDVVANDWMETHHFPEETEIQRFCLPLTGEARLWYETLRPIEVDWIQLQECFRQQYSKFGNTREQLFHVWRSFQYEENTDTIDTYISKIKQVALLLNYGEPQILELLKNTLLSKLYWVLFPINNLRDAVDAMKKSANKGEI